MFCAGTAYTATQVSHECHFVTAAAAQQYSGSSAARLQPHSHSACRGRPARAQSKTGWGVQKSGLTVNHSPRLTTLILTAAKCHLAGCGPASQSHCKSKARVVTCHTYAMGGRMRPQRVGLIGDVMEAVQRGGNEGMPAEGPEHGMCMSGAYIPQTVLPGPLPCSARSCAWAIQPPPHPVAHGS